MRSLRAAVKRRTGIEIRPNERYPFHTVDAINGNLLMIRSEDGQLRTPHPILKTLSPNMSSCNPGTTSKHKTQTETHLNPTNGSTLVHENTNRKVNSCT